MYALRSSLSEVETKMTTDFSGISSTLNDQNFRVLADFYKKEI